MEKIQLASDGHIPALQVRPPTLSLLSSLSLPLLTPCDVLPLPFR